MHYGEDLKDYSPRIKEMEHDSVSVDRMTCKAIIVQQKLQLKQIKG